MNIIGDIAGRFNELMALVAIMPKDEFLFVGDLMDRGPDSKKVIEWVHKNAKCIKGNHEDMFVDFILRTKIYHRNDFPNNGGWATLKSYGIDLYEDTDALLERLLELFAKPYELIPYEHILWLKELPLYYEEDGLLVTHAPLHGCFHSAGQAKIKLNAITLFNSPLWNRTPPIGRKNFQIFGHCGTMCKFGDWAVCIDDSHSKKLTGMSWPSKDIYQVEYNTCATIPTVKFDALPGPGSAYEIEHLFGMALSSAVLRDKEQSAE